jgi:hypothetical protein
MDEEKYHPLGVGQPGNQLCANDRIFVSDRAVACMKSTVFI